MTSKKRHKRTNNSIKIAKKKRTKRIYKQNLQKNIGKNLGKILEKSRKILGKYSWKIIIYKTIKKMGPEIKSDEK